MGSRTKRIETYGYSEMFNPDEDTFTRMMIQTAGAAKSIDSSLMANALLQVNKSFNYAAFQKLDGASVSTIKRLKLDESLAASLITDPAFASITSYTYATGGLTVQCVPSCWDKYGPPGYDCNNYIFGGIGYISAAVTHEFGYEVTFRSCAGSNDPRVVTDTGNKAVVEVFYKRSDGTDHSVYMPADRVSSEDTSGMEYSFLSAMMKANFIVDDTRYNKAIRAQLGIPIRTPDTDDDDDDGSEETLETLIDDPEVKHIWFSYSAAYEEPYITIIEEILGEVGFSFTAHGVLFEYKRGFSPTDPAPGIFAAEDYNLFVDNVQQPVIPDGDPDADKQTKQFMIPLEWLFYERTLKEKYTDLEKTMKLWVFTAKKTKL